MFFYSPVIWLQEHLEILLLFSSGRSVHYLSVLSPKFAQKVGRPFGLPSGFARRRIA